MTYVFNVTGKVWLRKEHFHISLDVSAGYTPKLLTCLVLYTGMLPANDFHDIFQLKIHFQRAFRAIDLDLCANTHVRGA